MKRTISTAGLAAVVFCALVVALPGRAEGGVIETADIFSSRDGRLVRADGYPPHPDRFAARGFDLAGLLA